jgi:protein AroM
MKPRLGLVTIGQAPRADIVPEMADLLGPGVEIVERGALDGLGRPEIAALAPGPGDDVLVTRLADGASVFLAKRHVTPRVQQKLDELDALGVAMTILLCTGKFEGLRASRPLLEPDKVLLGVIRGVRFAGRLGVLTPSERQVAQTERRWRDYGFDPIVVATSPYVGPASPAALAERFRAGGVGLLLLDCIGFRRPVRDALQAALGVPVIVANLLVARVAAEMLGA